MANGNRNSYNLEISGGIATLVIIGSLKAERANELKSPLMKALSGAERVRIRVESFTDMDMAILQLICSACQSASLMDKSMELEGEGLEEFLKTVESAGFSREALSRCSARKPMLREGI